MTNIEEPVCSMPSLPKEIVVWTTPPKSGLAVRVTLRTTNKNDFNFLVFTDAAGRACLRQSQYLEQCEQDRKFWLMDYPDPRTTYSGKIDAETLDERGVINAIDAFNSYREYFPFPDGYEQSLRLAASLAERPGDFKLSVKGD